MLSTRTWKTLNPFLPFISLPTDIQHPENKCNAPLLFGHSSIANEINNTILLFLSVYFLSLAVFSLSSGVLHTALSDRLFAVVLCPSYSSLYAYKGCTLRKATYWKLMFLTSKQVSSMPVVIFRDLRMSCRTNGYFRVWNINIYPKNTPIQILLF